MEQEITTLKNTVENQKVKSACKDCVKQDDEKTKESKCYKCKSYKENIRKLEKEFKKEFSDMKSKYKDKIRARDSELEKLRNVEKETKEKIIEKPELLKETEMKESPPLEESPDKLRGKSNDKVEVWKKRHLPQVNRQNYFDQRNCNNFSGYNNFAFSQPPPFAPNYQNYVPNRNNMSSFYTSNSGHYQPSNTYYNKYKY